MRLNSLAPSTASDKQDVLLAEGDECRLGLYLEKLRTRVHHLVHHHYDLTMDQLAGASVPRKDPISDGKRSHRNRFSVFRVNETIRREASSVLGCTGFV